MQVKSKVNSNYFKLFCRPKNSIHLPCTYQNKAARKRFQIKSYGNSFLSSQWQHNIGKILLDSTTYHWFKLLYPQGPGRDSCKCKSENQLLNGIDKLSTIAAKQFSGCVRKSTLCIRSGQVLRSSYQIPQQARNKWLTTVTLIWRRAWQGAILIHPWNGERQNWCTYRNNI